MDSFTITVNKTESEGYQVLIDSFVEGKKVNRVNAQFDSEESLRRFKRVMDSLVGNSN